MRVSIRRRHRTPDIWPGFVDSIASLLIIVIFLLMVFTLAQYFLSELLSGRNEALDRLNLQVAELSDMLALERGANTELREDLSQLSSQLQASISERDRLSGELAVLLPERDALAQALAERAAERDALSSSLAARTKELEDAYRTIEADKEKIELQLRRAASLERDIEALREVRKDLEAKVAGLAGRLAAQDEALTALRDRSGELEARLADERERTALAQREIDEKDVRLADLAGRARRAAESLTAERAISAEARRQVELLNLRIEALRRQLAGISAALEASEAKARAQGVKIVNLGRRLNAALASKVQELARYRSEFFGRLREALGDRRDIRIVGDRFVFQSEILFESGSADLQVGGKRQIARLAETLTDISTRIPGDIAWVLRVDGHTDRVPIDTPLFRTNWELSTGRAIAVVKYLIALGLPPERLAATGFGEHQPLDAGDDEAAYRRNRRIEFKLTER